MEQPAGTPPSQSTRRPWPRRLFGGVVRVLKPRNKDDFPWPVSRPGWGAHLFMIAFHLGTIAVGAVALIQPSMTLTRELDTKWLIYVWSSTFVVFGLVCLVARKLGEWKLEALALVPQMLALMVWGLALLTGSDNALQLGLRLVVGSVLLGALSCFVFDWIGGQKHKTSPPDEVPVPVLKRLTRELDEKLRETRDHPEE